MIRALRQLRADVECVGYGGPQMEAAGCRLLYPLCRLAVMWFARVLANGHVFLALLSKADRFFRHRRPDAVVLIDYPGFNWWVARRAHFHGIPVFYFVPPQLWAWAPWRVKKMRRWVDHVLCTLPFEEPWYRNRGVEVHHVGHPYFDALPRQQLDPAFLEDQRARPGTVVGLLPGSRLQELVRNFKTMVRAAGRIHAARPDTRFLVACFQQSHADDLAGYLGDCRLPIQVCVGRTPEVIHLARACVAVSGSVGLELLYHGKPSVVLYRIGRLDLRVGLLFKTSRYISLVNLLAGKELFPEYLTDRCESVAISGHILRWLGDRGAYDAVCAELAVLRRRVAVPGACERAARFVLAELAKTESGQHLPRSA
jgi:lipid-A-disaccharide synthase